MASAPKWIALALATSMLAGTAAQAQDIPQVISPLRVDPDHNNVNLVDGKTTIEVPALSVPAAPNLRFDHIQNAAPYVSGVVADHTAWEGVSYDRRSYSVHTGAESSESFQCADFDCTSVTGSGSTFIANVNRFTQAGSGAQYHFNNQHLHTQAPNERIVYYASSIDYPNGETITYSYDTATLTGDTIVGRVFYRPTTITSSLGYFISIAYQGSDFNGNTTAWSTPQLVALYQSAAPTTPLGRLTYSADGGTITDINGRAYHCTGCTNTLGVNLESAAGSNQLPTETAQAVQVTPVSGADVIASVTRDGVAWTYGYDNLRLDLVSQNYLYDHLTVAGPNGFHNVYDVAHNVVSPQTASRPASFNNFITRITDSIGRGTSYAYDEALRPVTITYPEGNSVSVGYDASGNINWRTTHAKPGLGLPDITESASFPVDTCGSSGYPVLCYRPTWSRDGLGRQTDYVYNNNGQLIEQTDPADADGVRRKTYITYDASSGISRRSVVRVCGFGTTCGTSAEIRTEYDYVGTPSPLLPSTERRIDAATGTTLTTVYAYDAAGRLLSTDGPLPGSADATYNRYDLLGRRTWQIGPAAPNGLRVATVTHYRDADDKVLYTEIGTIPDENSAALSVQTRTDLTYDSRRYPVRHIVSAGVTPYGVTDQSYNDRGQLVCSAVRMNPAAFGEAPGACAATTQGSQGPDRIAFNAYDAAGQLLQEVRAYGTSLQQNYATYSYSPNGRRTSVTDANGNRAEMTHDGYDRQRRWLFPSPTTAGVANPADYEEYGYDAVGNRTSLRRRDGTTLAYQYDNLNRMIYKAVPASAGGASGYSVFYGYDFRNAQLYARFGSASGPGVTNTYDGFGRQVSSSSNMDGVARTLSSAYDPGGRRIQITHSDGAFFTYAYDARGRLTLIREGGVIALNGYAFNDLGLGEVSAQSYEGGAAGLSSYGYDGIGRLNALTHDLVGSARDISFAFDHNPASQIVSRTRSNGAYAWGGAYNVSRGYAVNGLNQYITAGGATFGYDANGNLTSDGANAYTYDAENRLVAASGAHAATLAYDPLGRLWQVTNNATGAIARFLYDGDAVVGEYNTAGAMTARYVHGSNAAADNPLVWYDTIHRHYLVSDHQGSIVAVTDASGAGAVNSYDEWGIPGTSNIGRFQYTGQAWIPELGMYYYKARIYSPTLGRFMQSDPIGYDGGINLYAYVENDPVNRTDSTGLVDDDFRLSIGPLNISISSSNTSVSVGTAGFQAGLDVAGSQVSITASTPASSATLSASSAGATITASDRVLGSASIAVTSSGVGISTSRGTAGGERAGGPFTSRGREIIDGRNVTAHGRPTCESCRGQVVPGLRHQSGIRPPDNERQRDHIIPRSRGGDGSPSNGQVLCRACNLAKRDRMPNE